MQCPAYRRGFQLIWKNQILRWEGHGVRLPRLIPTAKFLSNSVFFTAWSFKILISRRNRNELITFYLSEAHMGSNHGKNGSRTSRHTFPLSNCCSMPILVKINFLQYIENSIRRNHNWKCSEGSTTVNPNKSGIGGQPPPFVQNDFTPWCCKLNIFKKSDMGCKLYGYSFWI